MLLLLLLHKDLIIPLANVVRLLAEQSDTVQRKVGFNPGFKHPTGLATLKSSDRTKQSVCG